ncbi:MAG: single-stranded-DNA-specific exonuclease RecJ [Peptococcaceae bacterium]|nr:single-stranded-DNA-specific exonuclease RecJ [Peptococcaceae bacterium]
MKRFPELNQKLWKVKTPFPVLSRILARQLGVSQVVAQLLINRGIHTTEQGRLFLSSDLASLHQPFLFRDMDKAVNRIISAVNAGEKILVYGDYDADGLTATALLVKVFKELGRDVSYYVPNRLVEGYGVHLEVLRKAREAGTSLAITVDCGISALAEARWSGENGLDLIITDHHEPPAEVPQAFALLNPKIPGCEYPFKELAGVGVALKLAQALLEAAGRGSVAWQRYLDLACLGTVADIVPLHGENRILVKHGLQVLARTKSPGLEALMSSSGIKKEDLGPREVGFGLAPRLNAAGRIGSPDLALKLLLTDNTEEAWELACVLNKGNQERQRIESAVLGEALGLLEERPDMGQSRIITLASENWHPGVIGIVASRLTERFYRPVFLLSLEGDEGKGSARSIPGFNIHQALSYCQKHLLDFGGHEMAAGFAIKRSNIESFYEELKIYAEKVLGDRKLMPLLDVDGFIDITQVSEELVNEIIKLSPYGHANPYPLLACRKATLVESRGVGKGAAHLKLRLRTDAADLDGIGFNLGAYAEVLAAAESVDIAFVPGMNEYNGRRSVQIEVKDFGNPALLDGLEQLQEGTLSVKDGIGEELFIPYFVLGKFKDLNNGRYSNRAALSSRIQDVELIDRRNSGDRPTLLARLASAGDFTLVVASCAYQVIELAHHIKLARPDLKGKVACCYQRNQKHKESVLTALCETGEAVVLVATPEAASQACFSAGQVLLYNLPYDLQSINASIEHIAPGGRLHFLCSDEDFQDNLLGLESMLPGREYLASIYHLLRREKKEYLTADLKLLRTAMVGAGFIHMGACTLKVAFTVLSELGLLNFETKDDFVRFHLLPAPAVKKDLFQSPTYKFLYGIKEDSISFMRKFLNEPVNNLLLF